MLYTIGFLIGYLLTMSMGLILFSISCNSKLKKMEKETKTKQGEDEKWKEQ